MLSAVRRSRMVSYSKRADEERSMFWYMLHTDLCSNVCWIYEGVPDRMNK